MTLSMSYMCSNCGLDISMIKESGELMVWRVSYFKPEQMECNDHPPFPFEIKPGFIRRLINRVFGKKTKDAENSKSATEHKPGFMRRLINRAFGKKAKAAGNTTPDANEQHATPSF